MLDYSNDYFVPSAGQLFVDSDVSRIKHLQSIRLCTVCSRPWACSSKLFVCLPLPPPSIIHAVLISRWGLLVSDLFYWAERSQNIFSLLSSLVAVSSYLAQLRRRLAKKFGLDLHEPFIVLFPDLQLSVQVRVC